MMCSGDDDMRTTLDLPDDLLEEAREVSGLSTKREVVAEALRQFIRRQRLEDLCEMIGKTDLTVTPEKLEWMRHES
jgi:Arc/MetJ family transcription regulator